MHLFGRRDYSVSYERAAPVLERTLAVRPGLVFPRFYRLPGMNFFYFDQSGLKRGPVSEPQLKELATRGMIRPRTPMETDTGHRGIASQIPGLFASNDGVEVRNSLIATASVACGIFCLVSRLSSISVYPMHIHLGFWSAFLSDIAFILGMFLGYKGLATSKAGIAKVGLLLCVISYLIATLYPFVWYSRFVFRVD